MQSSALSHKKRTRAAPPPSGAAGAALALRASSRPETELSKEVRARPSGADLQAGAGTDSGLALSAAEAAALLGVKAQTLYAYASRGLVRRVGTGKRRRYLLEDLQRLQTRQRARSGHGPVAAAALSFGEPVLDSSITAIDERGPVYRGHVAVTLAETGTSFEAVAELLWFGALPAATPEWQPLRGPAPRRASCASLEELLCALPGSFTRATERYSRAPEVELRFARGIICGLTELLAPGARERDGLRASPLARTRHGKEARARGGVATRAGDADRPRDLGVAPSIAERLSPRARGEKRAVCAALNLALVLIADHELNASSFAARVAASTDASLLACITAALATLSGPRHGGACDRVEALLDEAATLPRPSDVIERRARRGEPVPGFGHPLYPHGDPRATPLLERARVLCTRAADRQRLRHASALASAMARQGLPATVDFGLVVLTRALHMPPGSAALLFALGRSAGWVAHVLEQRQSPAVLRPRARYTTA